MSMENDVGYVLLENDSQAEGYPGFAGNFLRRLNSWHIYCSSSSKITQMSRSRVEITKKRW